MSRTTDDLDEDGEEDNETESYYDEERVHVPFHDFRPHSHLEARHEMNTPTYADFVRWSREQVASEEPKSPSFFLSPSVMVAGLFLAIVVAVALWWFFTRKKDDGQQQAAPANPAVAAAAAQSEGRPTKPAPKPRDGERVHYVTANGTPVDPKSVKHKK